MRIARSIRIVGLAMALLSVVTLASPAFSWAHDRDFGRGYHGANHGYVTHSPWHNGHHYWGGHPYYRPYHTGPAVSFAVPGFSFFIGP